MKNRLIIFLSLFILLGCSSQKNTTSYSKKQYNEYVSYYNRLKKSTSFDESCDDCSIQLGFNEKVSFSNKPILGIFLSFLSINAIALIFFISITGLL